MSIQNNGKSTLFSTRPEAAKSERDNVSSGPTLESMSDTEKCNNCTGLRVAAATPRIVAGDVEYNTGAVCDLIAEAEKKNIDLIVFPDLVLSGASCGDLFFQQALKDAVLIGLGKILERSETSEMLICLSLPLLIDNYLIKASIYLSQGEILGVHPSDNLSSAEQRWFTSASSIKGLYDHSYELLVEDPTFARDNLAARREELWWQMLDKEGSCCPLITQDLTTTLTDLAEPLQSEDKDNVSYSCDVLPLDFIPEHILRYPFAMKRSSDAISGLTVFAEIPAASKPFAAGGMRYLSNPQHILPMVKEDEDLALFLESANTSVPVVAISDSRPEYPLFYRQLRSSLLERSAKDECIIIYAASGENESASLHVYAGHRLICANGVLLAESEAFESGLIFADLTEEKVFPPNESADALLSDNTCDYLGVAREFPFLPPDQTDWPEYAYQVLDLQARGLASRLRLLDARPVLGLSGGVDSTLALFVCLQACRILKRPASDILSVSMPGPGSSSRSINIAASLAEYSGSDLLTIDISEAVRLHLKNIGHDGSLDHTFENAQARERTQILMDLANMKNGIVVGTGDLSELALGFCTYNADQMSMYSVNHSIPKTLARIMLDTFAADLLTGSSTVNSIDNCFFLEKSDQHNLANLLREIVSRPVSPELLPPNEDGTISQKTEEIIGRYEHNDFFLFYLIFDSRHPKEVYEIASKTFNGTSDEDLKKEMIRFIRRFVRNQFKRQPMPDGVQALPYSLSPHGAFQMPGDLSEQSLLDALNN